VRLGKRDKEIASRARITHVASRWFVVEAGEHNPSFDTLARHSSALGIAFHVAVTPAGVAI
jgi:hypothetical protein